MEHSYRFFENRACCYYPCHQGLEELNCLFCYCPLYGQERCPGNPRYLEGGGRRVKDCSGCAFPHQPGNYEAVLQGLAGE
ncbi:MAG: metal-binding protein [Lachnospiraceae bacterium]|nr:metal-binding protein [Lachnospiraceae bacterium]MCI9647456.1 metal-binding protein [Lachnospiraceae bacterium]